ncbi:MAG: glycosyltransferase family 87 protein [Pseudolabrys sp.]|nr:glycosyltransferase family 87 protein [Pseudolabrys sp.]
MFTESSLFRKVAMTWPLIAAIAYAADMLRTNGWALVDAAGRPLGDDFINYWSGAFLAWHGRATDVYNWPAYHAFQESIVGGPIDPYHYGYPPVLLILSAPLALLPYLPGLAAWLALSWFAFYRALCAAVPGRSVLLLAVATPAIFVNAIGGQNGAWSAALLGGALSLLERRPAIAGALFGLMIYKPQLGLLVPVALVAGGHWRAIAFATLSAGALLLASVLLFGLDAWHDYARIVGVIRSAVLEDGLEVWHRMLSVFVFARRLGVDVPVAYALQAAVAIAAAAVVARAWSRDTPAPLRNSLLVLGTCLATPYLQDYDLVVGAFVAVWLSSFAATNRSFERPAVIVSLAILLLPIAAAPFGKATGLAPGCLVIIAAFVLVARALPASRQAQAATVSR